jgi:hypothetical protein
MRLSYLIAILSFTLTATPASTEAGNFSLTGHDEGHLSESPGAFEQPGGVAGRNRGGKAFTKAGRAIVKEKNAAENDGKNRCENCGVETVPGKKHEKGVTPPPNEAHVDHIIPKVKGGPGEPDNGQVLCRECNLEKGDKAP